MAQSQNILKVLPGWSAMGARHIYPASEQERSLSPKGCETGGGGKLYKVKLLLVKTCSNLELSAILNQKWELQKSHN